MENLTFQIGDDWLDYDAQTSYISDKLEAEAFIVIW